MDKEKEITKEYISLQKATQCCSYSQQYLSLRARQKKLKALKFGRNWVTKKEWVEEYLKKIGEYNEQITNKKFKKAGPPEELVKVMARQGLISRLKQRLTGVRPQQTPQISGPIRPISERVKFGFVLALTLVLLFSGVVFALQTFEGEKEIKRISQKIVQGYAMANKFVEQKLGGFGKENLKSVFEDLDPVVRELTEVTNLAIEEIFQEMAVLGEVISGKLSKAPFLLEQFVQDFDRGSANLNQNLKIKNQKLKSEIGNLSQKANNYTYIVGEAGDIVIEEIGKSFTGSFATVAGDIQNLQSQLKNSAKFVSKSFNEGIVEISFTIYIAKENTKAAVSEKIFEVSQNINSTISAGKENARYGGRVIAAIASPETAKEIFAVFKEYGNWLVGRLAQGYQVVTQPFVKAYAAFGHAMSKAYQFVTQPWRAMPPEKIVVEKIKKEEIEKLQAEIRELKEKGISVREIEVSKITRIEPIKEITREVIRIDDKELTKINTQLAQFALWGPNIEKLKLAASFGYINLPPTLGPDGGTSVSTLGTITSGTWQASTITVPYGGTGITSVPAGYTLIGDTSNNLQATSTLFIDSSGNVGIGTTSPAFALDVLGAGRFTSDLTVGGDMNITGTTTFSGNLLPGTDNLYTLGSPSFRWENIYAATGTFGGTITINSTDITADSALNLTGAAASLWKTSSGALTIESADTLTATSTGDMIFGTAGAERMRILSTGLIGIGTSTPSALLEIFSDSSSAPSLFRVATGTTEALFVDSAGNVGIGTTTPGAKLDILASTDLTTGTYTANNTLLNINPTATSSANYYGAFHVADYLANYPTNSGYWVIGAWGEGKNSGTATLQNVAGAWYRSNNTSSGTINDSYGMVGQSRNSGTGTIVRGYGVVGAARNQSSGTITDAVGVFGDIINASAGGTITNAYNLRAAVPYTNAGTITNLYGVYIDAQSPTGGGTINNKWALYQAGSSDKSYFAGNVGIGTTSPSALLDIFSDSSSASSLFRIATGTTEALFVDGAGNVGIGTTTPAQTLHVEGQCVTGDTLLPVYRGMSSGEFTETRSLSDLEFVQIKDVKGGEYVLSLNEKTGELVPAKIKGLLDMGVKPIYEIETENGKTIRTTGNHPYLAKSVFNSSMLNMGDFNSSGLDENKFNSIIANSQSKLIEFPRPQFLHLGMLKGMMKIFQFANFIYNPQANSLWNFQQLFARPGLNNYFQHENYLALLANFLTSSNDIQDLSRSASLNRSSVSLMASGVDHSIKSIISSNNSLEMTFDGANTPRRLLSLMIVNDGDNFAIQNNDSISQNNLSNAQWIKVAFLEVGDEIAVADDDLQDIKFVKIKKITELPPEQVYDIEVEGTHNFIANGIVAHNTYLSGNVGIGTTSPTSGFVFDAIGAGRFSNGLTVAAGTVSLPVGQIDNAELANSSITVSAGTGLITGGTVSLGDSVTIDLGTLTGLTAGADTLAVNYGSDANTAAQGNVTLTGPGAGAGLTGGGGTIAVGAGGTFTTIDFVGDSTLTVSADSVGINLAQGNTWTATQTFSNTTYSALFTGGQVGIGTSTPSALLEIFSDSSSAPSLFRVATGTTEALFVDSAGNVGIGTTSPSALLDLFRPSSGNIFAISSTTAGDLVTIDNSGNVGIGTTSPGAKLDILASTDITTGGYTANNILLNISPTATSSANYYGAFHVADYQANYPINPGYWVIGAWGEGRNSGTSTLENVAGAWYRSNNISSGTINDSYGMVGQSRNSGSGTIVRGYGVVGAARNQLGGTITDAVGVYADLINASSTGTLTNAYNFYATNPNNAGTINNLYGLYIADQTSGTNHWAIYQAGADDNSYFAGNVGIGTTGPGSRLTVSGGASSFGNLATPSGVTATTTTGGNFSATGTYYYVVAAYDGTGLSSAKSSEVSCLIDPTSTACQISWTAVSGAATYRVFGRATGAQDEYWSTSSTSFTDTGTAGTSGSPPSAPISAYFAGNVGIGTTGPGGHVEIAGRSGEGDANLILSNADNTYNVIRFQHPSGTNIGSVHSFGPNFSSLGAWQPNTIVLEDRNVSLFASDASGILRFYTGGVNERVRIDKDGNVGIGTTAPGAKLDVSGNIRLTGTLLGQTSTGHIQSAIVDVSQANLVPQASFESPSFGTPDGWSIYTAPGADAAAISSTEQFYFGSQSFKVIGNGNCSRPANNYVGIRSQEITGIPAGATITFSVWTIQTDNAACGEDGIGAADSWGPGIEIQEWYDGVWNTNIARGDQQAGDSLVGTTWHQVTKTATLNSATTKLRIIILQRDPATISYLDGVSLTVGTFAPQFALKPLLDTGNQIIYGNVGIGTTSPSALLDLFRPSSGNIFAISSTTAGDLVTIDNSGNVGIGTTGPDNKLDVTLEDAATNIIAYPLKIAHITTGTAAANFGTGLQFNSEDTDGVEEGVGRITAYHVTHNTAKMDFQTIYGNDVWVTAMTLYNGNVGIGTTSPASLLDIFSDGSSASSLFRVATGTTEALFVDSAGNVGIGTTGPAGTLHLAVADGEANTVITPIILSRYWASSINTRAASIFEYTDNNYDKLAIGVSGDGGSYNAPNDLAMIKMVVQSNGNVGIGTTTPASLLDIFSDGSSASSLFRIATGTTEALFVDGASNVGIGTTGPDSRTQVTGGGLCVGSDVNCNTDNNTEGYVYAAQTAMIVYDVAENYPTKDATIEAGEVVTLDEDNAVFVKRSSSAYDPKLLGVISTKPAVLLGGFKTEQSQFLNEIQVPVTLSGRVPVKVSTENGAIAAGDTLTSASSAPGVAMKATQSGRVIGIALESFTENSSPPTGKIMVFVNPHWYGGQLSVDGSLAAESEQPGSTENGSLLDSFTQKVKQALASLGLAIENGIAQIRELVTDKLFAKKARIEKLEMVDKATGEIYCTWIENGEWQKMKGECDAVSEPPTEPLPETPPAETPPEEIPPVEEPPVDLSSEASAEEGEPAVEEPASEPAVESTEPVATEPTQSEQPAVEQQPTEPISSLSEPASTP